MKKYILILIAGICLSSVPSTKANAQAEQFLGLAKRVIKAIDLRIQRLQNNTINLQNIQQALQNALSKLKLNEITDWATKQHDLYKTFYDELWQVKSAISYYRKGKDIIEKQVALVGEYKRAYALFKQDSHFTPDEITYMGDIYNGILEESIKNLDQLQMVLNSFTLQIDDAKRLEIMDAAAAKINTNIVDLKTFNNSNIVISLQRAKDIVEIQQVEALYGLQ